MKKAKPGYCTICGKKIVLTPTASERAEKYGGKASDYTSLFTSHNDCFLDQRDGKKQNRGGN